MELTQFQTLIRLTWAQSVVVMQMEQHAAVFLQLLDVAICRL